MALKAVVENQSEIPEGVESFYEEQDGKFVLDEFQKISVRTLFFSLSSVNFFFKVVSNCFFILRLLCKLRSKLSKKVL